MLGQHESIVSMIDFYIASGNLHMVFEYCDGGDVMDVLVRKERFSEPLAAQVARNLVSAIAFCQEKNIAHRDIKGENVLCFGGQEDERQMRFKLTDFGAATYYGSWDEVHSQKIGSSCYVAPEGKLFLFTHFPSAAPGAQPGENALGRRGDGGIGAAVVLAGVRA